MEFCCNVLTYDKSFCRLNAEIQCEQSVNRYGRRRIADVHSPFSTLVKPPINERARHSLQVVNPNQLAFMTFTTDRRPMYWRHRSMAPCGNAHSRVSHFRSGRNGRVLFCRPALNQGMVRYFGRDWSTPLFQSDTKLEWPIAVQLWVWLINASAYRPLSSHRVPKSVGVRGDIGHFRSSIAFDWQLTSH